MNASPADHIQIILPERSDDVISSDLRRLTQILCLNRIGDDYDGAGGLGGDFGYGVNYENDTFMLHRFCWCEREDCAWCAGCECPPEAFHYFVEGREVDFDEWMDFYKTQMGDSDEYERRSESEWNDYFARAEQVNTRRTSRHDPVCRFCRGEFGNAPNFLHKPSGSRINWYKYIGRDMESELNVPWETIMADCLYSIGVR